MLIKYDSKLIILEASYIALLLEPADSISLCFFNIHTQTKFPAHHGKLKEFAFL